MFRVNNKDTRATPMVSCLVSVLVSLLLTLSRQIPAGYMSLLGQTFSKYQPKLNYLVNIITFRIFFA